MMPIDPMSQYDPATAALIEQQASPQQRVAQAMMQQHGGGIGGGLSGLGGLLTHAMAMRRGGTGLRPTGPDPVMGTGFPNMPQNQAQSLNYLNPNMTHYPPGYGPMGGP